MYGKRLQYTSHDIFHDNQLIHHPPMRLSLHIIITADVSVCYAPSAVDNSNALMLIVKLMQRGGN